MNLAEVAEVGSGELQFPGDPQLPVGGQIGVAGPRHTYHLQALGQQRVAQQRAILTQCSQTPVPSYDHFVELPYANWSVTYFRLLEAQITGQTFNICSGTSIHLLRVIKVLREISGHDPLIEVDPAIVRKDEFKDLCGSPRRLFETVGVFTPSHTISHREILCHSYQSLNFNAAPASSTGT
jgi:hypothetical protein